MSMQTEAGWLCEAQDKPGNPYLECGRVASQGDEDTEFFNIPIPGVRAVLRVALCPAHRPSAKGGEGVSGCVCGHGARWHEARASLPEVRRRIGKGMGRCTHPRCACWRFTFSQGGAWMARAKAKEHGAVPAARPSGTEGNA